MSEKVDCLQAIMDQLEPLQASRYRAALDKLSQSPPSGFDSYCRRLCSNRGAIETFNDLLAEARAATLFRRYGFDVEMRDSPDLRLSRCGSTLYAEVKRFREKEQDRIDDAKMAAYDESGLLVPIGDTNRLEGRAAWEQVVDVVDRKLSQLVPNAINLIVVISDSSHAIDDAILGSVMNEVDDSVPADRDYGKLNGVMLISNDWNLSQRRSVYFIAATCPLVPLGDALAKSLSNIRSE